jgi:hypothetical protein
LNERWLSEAHRVQIIVCLASEIPSAPWRVLVPSNEVRPTTKGTAEEREQISVKGELSTQIRHGGGTLCLESGHSHTTNETDGDALPSATSPQTGSDTLSPF